MGQSLSTSATLDVTLGFDRMELAVAKIVVREQIARGLRKGPSDLLILPDHLLDEWLEAEAVHFLQEQKARRQGYAEGNEGSQLRSEDEGARRLGESLRSLPSEHGSELQDGQAARQE